MNIYNAIPGEPIPLGHRWENNALRVAFDISAWVDAFGAGTVRLLHQRQGDAAPYPVSVTRTDADGTPDNETGTLVLWDVSNADTAQVCHFGRAELRYYAGREGAETFLAKSDIWKTEVLDALGGAQADAPEAQREWLDELMEAADGIEANVAAAQAAQERTQAVATRIDNQFFYIDKDPESETYGHLMWVHDANTDYDPEALHVIAYGDEWRFDSSGVLTITHRGTLNTLPDLGDYATTLRRVILPYVKTIGLHAFSGCSSVESVIADNVTAILGYAFYNCSSLRSVTMSDGIMTIYDEAFYGCSSLTSATIPGSVRTLGSSVFYGCSSLASVIIGNGVSYIPLSAFSYCSSLTSVTIPESVTRIREDAFQFCSSLTSVTIPEGVTSIEKDTFYYCSSLTSVTIPSSVTRIENDAFAYCYALTDVYYRGSEEQRNGIVIINSSRNWPLLSATWHYNWEG